MWLFQTKSKQGRHTFLKIPPEIFYFLTLPLKIPDKTPPLEIPGFSLLERWGESSPQAKNVLIPPPTLKNLLQSRLSPPTNKYLSPPPKVNPPYT